MEYSEIHDDVCADLQNNINYLFYELSFLIAVWQENYICVHLFLIYGAYYFGSYALVSVKK